MKRTPLKRHTPLRRTGFKRRGTPLRAGQPRRRTPLRATKSGRARPDEPLATWCEAQIPDVCSGRAEHRHHRLLRKHGGTDDRSNTTDLCHRCHGHVHANTGWAYSVGLLVHAWEEST
jgi:hypothetical protein